MSFKSNKSLNQNQKKVSHNLSDSDLKRLEKRALSRVRYFQTRVNEFSKRIAEAEGAGEKASWNDINGMHYAQNRLSFWQKRLDDLNLVTAERILLEYDTDSKN